MPIHIVFDVCGIDRIVCEVGAVDIFSYALSTAMVVCDHADSGANSASTPIEALLAIPTGPIACVLSLTCDPVLVIQRLVYHIIAVQLLH